MEEQTWHPYGPDRQFGQQAAADAEVLDLVCEALEHDRRPAPRAGNKAPVRDERAGPR